MGGALSVAGASDRETVVRNVLSASLLEGSGKVIETNHGTFLVLEPSIGPADVAEWVSASPDTPAPESSDQRSDHFSPDNGHYERQGQGEYFDNDIADRWQLRHWGYWGEAMELMGLPVAVESDVHFRSDTSSPALRVEVADYLDGAPFAVVGVKPSEPCYLCDRTVPVASHQSDGEWLWPAYMGHLVREHHFVVPNALVDRIRSMGSPPADLLGVDVEQLPWP